MHNLKWGIKAGIAALAISLLLGFISGVNLFHIFIRSFVFTVVFFGMGMGARILLNTYFPELLSLKEEPPLQPDFEKPGSMVDITLDSMNDCAVPEKYKDSQNTNELGNVEDLISGVFRPIFEEGIDRKREEDYNNQRRGQGTASSEDLSFQDLPSLGGESFERASFEAPAFTPGFGDNSEDLGGLPDLGSMAMVFSGSSREEPLAANTTTFGFGEDPFSTQPHSLNEAVSLQPNKGNKPVALQGDFNPKELAAGIRTVLSKDK